MMKDSTLTLPKHVPLDYIILVFRKERKEQIDFNGRK